MLSLCWDKLPDPPPNNSNQPIRFHKSQELREKQRPVPSTKFAHDHENEIIASYLYIPKRKKVVVLLSSSHDGNEIVPANANKPRMILDYNAGKKGVDQMNENIFNSAYADGRQFGGRSWSFLHKPTRCCFFQCLSDSYRNNGSNATRKEFLKSLSKQLCQRSVARRFARNQRLSLSSIESAIRLGFIQSEQAAAAHGRAAVTVSRCRIGGKTSRSKCNMSSDMYVVVICP